MEVQKRSYEESLKVHNTKAPEGKTKKSGKPKLTALIIVKTSAAPCHPWICEFI